MNREYYSRVSSKNSKWLLKNLINTTGDYAYFFAAPCIARLFVISGVKSVCTTVIKHGMWS